jgi:hypothetical protein
VQRKVKRAAKKVTKVTRKLAKKRAGGSDYPGPRKRG